MSSSCPIALIIRRQTATPALSPSAASSSAGLLLSASAVSPYHHSIREAARKMSDGAILTHKHRESGRAGSEKTRRKRPVPNRT